MEVIHVTSSESVAASALRSALSNMAIEERGTSAEAALTTDVSVELSDAATDNTDPAPADEDALAEFLKQATTAAQAENGILWWLSPRGFADPTVSVAFDASHASVRLQFCAVLSLGYFFSFVLWIMQMVVDGIGEYYDHYWFWPNWVIHIYCCIGLGVAFFMCRHRPVRNRQIIKLLSFAAILMVTAGAFLL